MIRRIFIYFRQRRLYNRLHFKLQLWRYYFRRLLGRASGRPLRIPMFEISSCPTIALSEVRNRRFNLVDRAQHIAMQELSMQGMPANETAFSSSIQISKFEFILSLDYDNSIINQTVEKLCQLN